MRIFIAIRFTEAFKEPIFEAQDALRDNGVRGNFTLPENLHLTLAFIGETDKVDDIKAAVKEVFFVPFEIKTGRLGCFNGRSKVIWLGIDGEKKLKSIAAIILTKEVLSMLRVGSSPTSHSFACHLACLWTLTLRRQV